MSRVGKFVGELPTWPRALPQGPWTNFKLQTSSACSDTTSLFENHARRGLGQLCGRQSFRHVISKRHSLLTMSEFYPSLTQCAIVAAAFKVLLFPA